MSSYLARLIRITYGTLVIGESEDLQPTGPVEISKADDSFSCSFSFVYSTAGLADPGASFEAELAVIDSALRNREQTLLVEYGAGLALKLLDIGGNTDTQDTGLNVRCEWTKSRNPLNTNRSAHYDVVISGGLPPSDPARAGRREFGPSVSYDGSRRLIVAFAGEWTRVGAVGATAGYLAGIDALSLPYLAAQFPGRVFEPVAEEYVSDEEDDVATYSKPYREILVPQAGAGTGVLDDPDFTDQTLVITRSRTEAAGPEGDAEPLVALNALMTTRVNRELNTLTNVGISRLDVLIETKIKPSMIAALREATGTSTMAIVSFTPDLDPTTNQLRVSMDAVSTPGGNTLERVLITQDGSQSNTILRKAYLNGGERDQPVPSYGANLFDQPLVKIPRAWKFETAGAVRRRISDQRTLLGTSRFQAGAGGGAGGPVSSAGAGAQGSAGGTRVRWDADAAPAGQDHTPNAMVVGRQFSVRNSARGIKGFASLIPVVEVLSVIDLEFFDPIAGSPNGSGGGSSVGGTRTRGSAGSESTP